MTRPSTKRNSDAQFFRAAAKRLEDGLNEYACHALADAGAPFTHADRLKEIFAPDVEDVAWLRGIGGTGGRILALCFMAAMVEAGDA